MHWHSSVSLGKKYSDGQETPSERLSLGGLCSPAGCCPPSPHLPTVGKLWETPPNVLWGSCSCQVMVVGWDSWCLGFLVTMFAVCICRGSSLSQWGAVLGTNFREWHHCAFFFFFFCSIVATTGSPSGTGIEARILGWLQYPERTTVIAWGPSI